MCLHTPAKSRMMASLTGKVSAVHHQDILECLWNNLRSCCGAYKRSNAQTSNATHIATWLCTVFLQTSSASSLCPVCSAGLHNGTVHVKAGKPFVTNIPSLPVA